ncbi:proto-oncogene serine/threonine-protein kinase mos [Paramormyrops kingsleyae]|uniref:proto-oncogene serine/threonine-protein kinase mos n=1 Tax=Paramormyrops kingsleyae TaxID=1676925 RepID=UPI000CD62891|nr:proto-oncogene serine/threonine-protein kinase mos [Paramormyrops kingsleyae]
MPSPIPVSRLLHKGFGATLEVGACSSPLTRHGKNISLRVPRQNFPTRCAHKLWSSVVNWKELRHLCPIGSGGFGSVYKGRYFDETVAVKKVKKCAKNKLASRQSFWSELNAAHLRHKNIVRIIAATTCIPPSVENEDNIGTIVMEYAGCVSLHHLIYCSTSELEMERCMKYALGISSGMDFLHSHYIAHLDLKPANVLITEEDDCKIADFGCSQKLEPCNHAYPVTSHIGGTYTHRAPEILKGSEVTLKADIYSFAITFWQLITRDQPYEGERQAVLYAVVAFDLRPKLTGEVFMESSLGKKCRSLICRCWTGDPAQRPSSKEVLSEIETMHMSTFKVP